MAEVRFSLVAPVALDADEAHRRMCDWADHARWVPFTRVAVHAPDRFTAWTGVGRLSLEDNMTVVERDDAARHVKVVKTGPTITGSAEFRIRPDGAGRCVVEWTEEVEIPRLPRFLVPLARWGGRMGFRTALRRFAR